MKVSILIPCYNEEKTIREIVDLVLKSPIPYEKEIVIVDDFSKDGTRDILEQEIKPKVSKILYHDKNKGKGAAIQTGITHVTGDVLIIQDADLEYDPDEYVTLLEPIEKGYADVVYGSRFLTREMRRIHYFWHTLANFLITQFFNTMANTNFTDVETCYKVFTKKIYSQITLKENRFAFDPEITAKAVKLGAVIYEVSISYHGRTYDEGKKIGFWDAVSAARCILKYNLFHRSKKKSA
ncbi:MAG: glycosyltransferase family 2 protein [Candidatus Margulisbacteria bacterium]|nr:glycosyltransferase family 2 protein [Candidatus Margulisiibacteriota bacterium]